MGRPYYSRIARAWHDATGPEGGPLKKYVLNELLLQRIPDMDGMAVLEIGAGNGYFSRLLMNRRGGQVPARFVITDASAAVLRYAEQCFRVPSAEYQALDIGRTLPFSDGDFGLILATMVFNELRDRDLAHALLECRRILTPGGRLLATVVHPDFVARLDRNNQLREWPGGLCTMPAAGELRVPVVRRSLDEYRRLFHDAGFAYETQPVIPTDRVLRERPGLRHAAGVPLALIYDARRSG